MSKRIDYRRVASIYMDAAAKGQDVTGAVADALGVTTTNAAQIIFRARRQGLLPKVDQRGINAVRSTVARAETDSPQGQLL